MKWCQARGCARCRECAIRLDVSAPGSHGAGGVASTSGPTVAAARPLASGQHRQLIELGLKVQRWCASCPNVTHTRCGRALAVNKEVMPTGCCTDERRCYGNAVRLRPYFWVTPFAMRTHEYLLICLLSYSARWPPRAKPAKRLALGYLIHELLAPQQPMRSLARSL